jgi:hypothetical protein
MHIIAMTADAMDDNAPRCLMAGMNYTASLTRDVV